MDKWPEGVAGSPFPPFLPAADVWLSVNAGIIRTRPQNVSFLDE